MRILCCLLFLLLFVTASSPVLNSSAQERQMGGVGITIFTDRNFRGQSSTFHENVPDLEPLGLNDKISSLKVGRREQWEVCEHANYQGRCVVVSGTEPDLRKNSWNDNISSLRRVRGGGPLPPNPGPPSGADYIVLFDQTNYRGNPKNYDGPNPSVGVNAQSVTIGRGAWELCDGQNYSGQCVTLERSVPDFRGYGLRGVYSVRPVGSGGSQPPPSTSDWYIVIFDRERFQGNPTNYNGPESNTYKLARSITIGKGVWQLCQGRNFTGRCITLNRSVPDLRSYNLRQVSSLRPVIREPR